MLSTHSPDFALDYSEERLPDGVRFLLPTRQLGQIRWLGLAAVVAALFGLVFMGVWLSIWVAAGWQLAQQGQWFGWILCAMGLAVLATVRKCWQLLFMGIGGFTNRTFSEIEIRDETMILHERFLSKRWTRKIRIPVADIGALRVGLARHARSQADDVAIESWLGPYDSAIFVEVDHKKAPVVIAPCYPQTLLMDFADRLAVLLPGALVVEPHEPVTARPSLPDSETQRVVSVVKQPVDTDIEVERRTDGTTYRVPPAGMLKGSKGLFLFAVIWNALIGVFIAVFVVSMIQEPKLPHFVASLALLPFVAVGVGTALCSINMGRRKTAIVTAGDQLLVISEGIFGKKTRCWQASDLSSVHMGPSGMSVNDVPVMELQFNAGQGKFGVLSERDNDELEWLAVQISLEMGLLEIESASEPVAT